MNEKKKIIRETILLLLVSETVKLWNAGIIFLLFMEKLV